MVNFEFAGTSLEVILLVSSVLLVLSVIVSRLSGILGMPALLLFIGLGMLAGSEGPGGIAFANYSLTFAVGSVSLALILFDGGFRTSWIDVRPVLATGVSLSTVGVVTTALITGVFSRYVLNLDWAVGLLLGAIVSSTDAAAVFSVLRSSGLGLRGKVKQALEFEAGSNDPTAVFLTIAFLSFATNPESTWVSFMILFFKQASLGLFGGYVGGRASAWLVNRLRLQYEGLYSVLLLGLIALVFSFTSLIGGSGFLAVYVTGLALGNSDLLHKGSLLRFYDGIAWIAQIALFLVLGLLVFPTHLLSVWKEGILLALFLSLIARPLSVSIAAPSNLFSFREKTFVSWVGLRGAAPIVLATLPWSTNFAQSEYIFNLVFFVVLFSVLLQGTSIPFVARSLGVAEELPPHEAESVNAGALAPGFVPIRIQVASDAPAVGKQIVELRLPSGVLFTAMQRRNRFIVPRGDSIIESGDLIDGLARDSSLAELSSSFGDGNVNVNSFTSRRFT